MPTHDLPANATALRCFAHRRHRDHPVRGDPDEDLAPSLALVPSRRTTIGQGRSRVLDRFGDPLRYQIAPGDPTEYVDQNRSDRGSWVTHVESVTNRVCTRRRADIGEVGGVSSTKDTTSNVDITSPAPLPMTPTEPSSLMKLLRSRWRAMSSIGSV